MNLPPTQVRNLQRRGFQYYPSDPDVQLVAFDQYAVAVRPRHVLPPSK